MCPVGRPKVKNPKSKHFSIRLSMETEMKLKEYCLEHKITKDKAIS